MSYSRLAEQSKECLLSVKGLTKHFGSTVALDHVDLDVNKGEMLALLGENGAGKSTFMNCVLRFYEPTGGEIRYKGSRAEFKSPQDAIARGVYMVHQSFSLIPSFTVAENVCLVPQLSKNFFTDMDNVGKLVTELGETSGLEVDPKIPVGELPIGLQQRVEILKALVADAQLLMLDEPTSVLTPQGAEQLLKLVRSRISEGLTVIMSTHKLSEALQFSDRIAVLRRGKLVALEDTEVSTEEKLVEYMVGRSVSMSLQKSPPNFGKLLVSVRSLTVKNDMGREVVKDVSFSVHEGEIFGIAGVAGNGQLELEHAITGRRRSTSGNVFVNGSDVANRDAGQLAKFGVAVVPGDGESSGLNATFSLARNSILTALQEKPFSHNLVLKEKEIMEHCQILLSEYDVRPSDAQLSAQSLSGGNRQKLLLSRELIKVPFLTPSCASCSSYSSCLVIKSIPSILIACNPTRGLDVLTRKRMHEKLLAIRQNGGCVVLISDDLDEIMSLSDTLGVMFRGRIVKTLRTAGVSITEVARFMTGSAE